MNSKQNKYARRDKKRNKRKHGMRVVGKSVFVLQHAGQKAAKSGRSE